MNKKELSNFIKKYIAIDVDFDIELVNNTVDFSLYGFDRREVCCINIPYSGRLEKEDIYIAISKLITEFDFSYRLEFDNIQDIYDFLKCSEIKKGDKKEMNKNKTVTSRLDIEFGCGKYIDNTKLNHRKIYVDKQLNTFQKYYFEEANINHKNINYTLEKIKNFLFVNEEKTKLYIGNIQNFLDYIYILKQVEPEITLYNIFGGLEEIFNCRTIEHIQLDDFISVVLPRLLWILMESKSAGGNAYLRTIYPDYLKIISDLDSLNSSDPNYLLKNINYEIFGVGEHCSAFTKSFFDNLVSNIFNLLYMGKGTINSTTKENINIDGKPWYTDNIIKIDNFKFEKNSYSSTPCDTVIFLSNSKFVCLQDELYNIYNKILNSNNNTSIPSKIIETIALIFIDKDKISKYERSNMEFLPRIGLHNFNHVYTSEVWKNHNLPKMFSINEVNNSIIAENYFSSLETFEVNDLHPFYSTLKVKINHE